MTENLFNSTDFGRVAEVQGGKGTFGGLFCSRPVTVKSHLCPRSWFMHQGEQAHTQGSPPPLFNKRKIRLNRDHPLSQLPQRQGSKHLPLCWLCWWLAQPRVPRARGVPVLTHPQWFCMGHRGAGGGSGCLPTAASWAGCCQLSLSSYSPHRFVAMVRKAKP